MCDIAYVNNTAIIARNPQVTAINSCIEVDITGQVVSDSIGTYMYSGEYSPHLFIFVLLCLYSTLTARQLISDFRIRLIC